MIDNPIRLQLLAEGGVLDRRQRQIHGFGKQQHSMTREKRVRFFARQHKEFRIGIFPAQLKHALEFVQTHSARVSWMPIAVKFSQLKRLHVHSLEYLFERGRSWLAGVL